jgi:hypothetical protein
MTEAKVSSTPQRGERFFAAWYNLARTNEALGSQMPAAAKNRTDQVWTIKALIEMAADA